ncbi:MarR family transcriptional regulator [Vibrio sinensis]|uniref:MarR family transcriptional regulator n=1 Tax=Vibrio sinensis TaxID=2302434 RepID=A0A3A6Q969_9VIBR|nr:MarR family transcriptional regulator [Vibrio sinensis]RJX68379.1 MarR family transcriptional regulator [Vibrio sinensis]
MRLAHKRKVQAKLQKRIKATVANIVATKTVKPAVEIKVAVAPAAEKVVASVKKTESALTPKQQQVLDIVANNAEGINPKGIGLAAGQEEAKAASWATGALKKLLDESLVVKEQLAGNKVIYKAV